MSPMILDNLGIQVDLASATKRAAEMYGVEADQLTKTQQQAGMMSVVLEKLEANTKDMPDVAGTAAQSFATLKANVANLKEEIGMKLLPVFTAVTEGLNDWISSPEGQASIDKFVSWVGKVIGTADPPTGLTGIVTYLLSGDIKSAVDLAFGEGTYAALRDFVKGVQKAADDIAKIIQTMKDAWKSLRDYYAQPATMGIAGVATRVAAEKGVTSFPTGYTGTSAATRKASGMGWASGGSFVVPGVGATDRPYTMNLRPGEVITARSPGKPDYDLAELVKIFGIDYDKMAIIVRDAVMQVAR